jgi:hypothetical protein
MNYAELPITDNLENMESVVSLYLNTVENRQLLPQTIWPWVLLILDVNLVHPASNGACLFLQRAVPTVRCRAPLLG